MTTTPGMMLWTDAYMADTSHLTTTEHGAYLLILMAMWRAGGSLANDDVRLARIAKLTLDKWRRIAPTIREFFTIDGEAVTQKRLKLELEIALSKTEKLKAAGRSGGRAKALKNNNHAPSIATGNVIQLPVAKSYDEPSLPDLDSDKKEKTSFASPKDDHLEGQPKRTPKRRTLIDPNITLTTEMREAATKCGIKPELQEFELAKFRDYHAAKGSVMADWLAAWRTWARNSVSFAQVAPNARASPGRAPSLWGPGEAWSRE